MKVARGRIDAELKNALTDLIDGIKLDGASMGMGLRLLDEAMADVATRLSEIRRYTKKPLLAPNVAHPCSHVVLNRFDGSNPLCSATLCATTADLTRIVKENHELTTQANNMIEVLSGRARPPGPLPELNDPHAATLIPAVQSLVRREIVKSRSFLANQASEYHKIDRRWKRSLYQWEHNRDISFRKTVGKKRQDSQRSAVISRTSLFTLDALRSMSESNMSCNKSFPSISMDDNRAPTRARKALRDEATENERVISDLLASSAKEARIERGVVNEEDIPAILLVSALTRVENRLRDTGQSCRHIPDPYKEKESSSRSSLWSNLEKCVFLDKFLQYPKNFGKIATFILRKNACDCAQLYYNSKYAIDYKALLREHQQRRRGVRICWDVTAKAVQTFGGQLEHDPQCNIVWFRLPANSFEISCEHTPAPKNPPSAGIFATFEEHLLVDERRATVVSKSPSTSGNQIKQRNARSYCETSIMQVQPPRDQNSTGSVLKYQRKTSFESVLSTPNQRPMEKDKITAASIHPRSSQIHKKMPHSNTGERFLAVNLARSTSKSNHKSDQLMPALTWPNIYQQGDFPHRLETAGCTLSFLPPRTTMSNDLCDQTSLGRDFADLCVPAKKLEMDISPMFYAIQAYGRSYTIAKGMQHSLTTGEHAVKQLATNFLLSPSYPLIQGEAISRFFMTSTETGKIMCHRKILSCGEDRRKLAYLFPSEGRCYGVNKFSNQLGLAYPGNATLKPLHHHGAMGRWKVLRANAYSWQSSTTPNNVMSLSVHGSSNWNYVSGPSSSQIESCRLPHEKINYTLLSSCSSSSYYFSSQFPVQQKQPDWWPR